jgi:hypothetical protein
MINFFFKVETEQVKIHISFLLNIPLIEQTTNMEQKRTYRCYNYMIYILNIIVTRIVTKIVTVANRIIWLKLKLIAV